MEIESMENKELLELIRKLSNGEGNDQEAQEWLETINKNVPFPNVSELIFYNQPELSPEEILQKALDYKPIIL